MALKALVIGAELRAKKSALEAVRVKKAELKTREAELAKAIEEVNEKTSDDDLNAISELVDELTIEKNDLDAKELELDRVIGEMEAELASEEARQDTTPPAAAVQENNEKRGEKRNMKKADFFGMSIQERDAFFARSDVKDYLAEVRTSIREKRAIANVGLTVPVVMLDLLREYVGEYSKLYKHVRVARINGDGRQVIMGTIPEGIWTDCCANLNEMSLGFNDLEMNCYRVGGYFAVCNANLEDSDVDLAAEIFKALGQAIGVALDKAILFGRNAEATLKMPLGIASRLAQTSQPEGYPVTARPWVDLHSSNIKTIASTNTGLGLFQAIIMDLTAAKSKYSRGDLVHVMSEGTYTYLMAQAMAFEASGAIVSGLAEKKMPVIGGVIETLNFIPDNVMISGYFDNYTLAERSGQKFAQSEHIRFFQDQTVMKGTARYDGAPAIAEAFVVIGFNGVTPDATAVTFAPDEANDVQSITLNTATATVAVGSTVQLFAITAPGTGTVTWTSGTVAKATVDSDGVVTGVASGSSVITASCNGKTASCTVTVTS